MTFTRDFGPKASAAIVTGVLVGLLWAGGVAMAGLQSACASHTPPSTTPILSPTSTTLLETSLGALQTAAIALAPVDGIPQADTAVIINAVTAAITTLNAGQTGWLSALDTALSKIPALLSPSTAATLQPYFDAVSAVILDLYSTGVA
jgi:hypothetical protein